MYFGIFWQQKATDFKNNRFQNTTDLKKQQISKNNQFQKTTNFKTRLQKQQISKNSRFQEIDLKNNRFQKTTNSKKQRISTIVLGSIFLWTNIFVDQFF